MLFYRLVIFRNSNFGSFQHKLKKHSSKRFVKQLKLPVRVLKLPAGHHWEQAALLNLGLINSLSV